MVKSSKTTDGPTIRHYRNRAAPRVALAKRTEEPISRFFQRLGVIIYGPEGKDIKPQNVLEGIDKLPGSVENSATDIADQIRNCLRLGSLTAVVTFSVTRKVGVSLFDNGDSSDTDASDDPDAPSAFKAPVDFLEWARASCESSPETDHSQPILKTFTIRSTYWERDLQSLNLDWSTSSIDLDGNYLDESDLDYPETRSVTDRYDGISGSKSIVFIENPDEALRKVFSYVALPNDDWFSRYAKYRTEGRLEALAAGWRIIALKMRNGEPITANSVGLLMQHYLETQGEKLLGDSPTARDRKSSFNAMAKNMLAQLDAGDGSSSVLVSSVNYNRK